MRHVIMRGASPDWNNDLLRLWSLVFIESLSSLSVGEFSKMMFAVV